MAEKLTIEKVKQFIELEVDEFFLEDLRKKHGIDAASPNFYMAVKRLMEQKYIKKVKRGVYKKVRVAQPVKVFGREIRPPITFNPPLDRETLEPMDFFNDIIFREGDFLLLSGFKNKGKTALCLNIAAENLDKHPVLMGNEYVTMTSKGEEYEPSARLVTRLKSMDWVQWVNGNGEERFELLPVWEDYAEQVRADRMNIIDWINVPGDYWMISPISEAIKRAVGRGIVVGVLQKNPGSEHGRGGNPSKDFADAELLLDPYGDDPDAVLLTVATVKESRSRIAGRRFVYKLRNGVKITDYREVVKCMKCYGKGWGKTGPCLECNKTGYVDKEI